MLDIIIIMVFYIRLDFKFIFWIGFFLREVSLFYLVFLLIVGI